MVVNHMCLFELLISICIGHKLINEKLLNSQELKIKGKDKEENILMLETALFPFILLII